MRTTHWLIANLRPGKQFQIYHFNTEAAPLVAGTDGKWLSTDDAAQMSAAIRAAREFAPAGGTSLHRAFAVIERLSPRPDSVILLTDGLPTQGRVAEKDRLINRIVVRFLTGRMPSIGQGERGVAAGAARG